VITLEAPIAAVLGDHPKKRKAIVEGLHLETVGDLLHHFPRRYLETGKLSDLGGLQEGQLLTIVGEVGKSEVKTYTDRRTGKAAYRVEVQLHADGNRLKMTFFAKNSGMANSFSQRLSEGPSRDLPGQGVVLQPVAADQPADGAVRQQGRGRHALLSLETMPNLFPIYPLTKGVDTWDLQRAATFALSVLDEIPEVLDDALRAEYDVVSRRRHSTWIHAPDDFGQVAAAKRRFRFEEALVLQLVLGRRRRELQALGAQARTGGAGDILGAFDARLPFELTAGQRAVGKEIEHELAQPHPMHRLLQGEVGSGKTLVALRAMLARRRLRRAGRAARADRGARAAALPLHHGHARRPRRGGMLGGAAEATKVVLLTGSMTKAQRPAEADARAGHRRGGHRHRHPRPARGQGQFHDLGLVVVDEQHRFGVEQRDALHGQGKQPPHVLVMTATPIPRTVAMTVFGDLEVRPSTELPAGRCADRRPASSRSPSKPAGWAGPGSGSARRSRRAIRRTSSARASPATSSEQGEHDVVEFDEEGDVLEKPGLRRPSQLEEASRSWPTAARRAARGACCTARWHPTTRTA
jgi:ATP-dependent DNA helicase RecG